MHFLSAILLGLSTNLDNLVVGVAVGMRGKRISPAANACIALGSALACFLFCALSSLFSEFGRLPNALGGAMLILLGIHAWFARDRGAGSFARTAGENPSVRELLLISGSLAVNCMAPAFAAGLTGIGPLEASAMTGLFSYLSVAVGAYIGGRVQRQWRRAALEAASCAAMIALGLLEMLI